MWLVLPYAIPASLACQISWPIFTKLGSVVDAVKTIFCYSFIKLFSFQTLQLSSYRRDKSFRNRYNSSRLLYSGIKISEFERGLRWPLVGIFIMWKIEKKFWETFAVLIFEWVKEWFIMSCFVTLIKWEIHPGIAQTYSWLTAGPRQPWARTIFFKMKFSEFSSNFGSLRPFLCNASNIIQDMSLSNEVDESEDEIRSFLWNRNSYCHFLLIDTCIN